MKGLGVTTKITWIAGHVDLDPNEKADLHAKEAAQKFINNDTFPGVQHNRQQI